MELQHHGIEGQKWGVKNGPPYPLEISKKNARKLTKKVNNLNNTYAKLNYQQQKYTRKAQRLADKGKDATEYINKGKQYLNSKKAIEFLQNSYIKEAKDSGYEVTNRIRYYDGRPASKQIMSGGAFGTALSIKQGDMVIRPYYKIKMPKISIE